MEEANEKKIQALIRAVGDNRDRLRIDELRKFHDQSKGTDSSINLIAQLTALKSNLGSIQDLLNFAVQDLHPQVLSDLEVLMVSCGSLVRHLHSLTERLNQPGNDAMDFAVKLKYAVGSRSMERLRDVARRQNEAVTLLLAACQCHASAQRKILLHKSRQIRKEDAASLKMLARSTRLNGTFIGMLTQVSRVIQCFRRMFHMEIARDDVDRDMTPAGEWHQFAASRSDAIDRALQEEAINSRQETKLLMVGDFDSGKQLIMHQMKILYAEDHFTEEQRFSYCFAVRSTVRLLIHSIIDLLKDTGVSLPNDLNHHFAILLNEVEITDILQITPEAVKAIQAIWHSAEFSPLYIQNFEIDFPQYASYFAKEVARVAQDDYIPTEADIIRLNQDHGCIKEVHFRWDHLDVHLFNVNGHIHGQFQKRMIHHLDNVASLVYTADVSRYDRPHLGHAAESHLLYDFHAFESWANAPKFANSTVILLLNNFTRFCDKLKHLPLSTFFPDYKSDEFMDPETSARQYILQRFKALNRNGLTVFSFWVDLDLGDNQPLYAALKNTLHQVQQRKVQTPTWSEGGTNSSSGNMWSRSHSSMSGKKQALHETRSSSALLDGRMH